MKTLSIALCLLITPALVSLGSAAALTFTEIDYFPDLAPASFGYQGVGLPDGRLLLWNGDAIYIQSAPGSETLSLVASGYAGDPGFVALASDGHSIVLGAGYSGVFYQFDADAPIDYTPASEIGNLSHFSGLFLDDDLLLVDAGRSDFTGSDLIIVDTSEIPSTDAVVIAKPDFAYSCTLYLTSDESALYAMDGNTGELRRFDPLDLLVAYALSSTVSWASGELIGTPGDFYTLGVCGMTPTGNIILAGAEGFGLPGGIQIVDPQTGNIVIQYDPSGINAYTSVIYNQYSRDIFAYADEKVYHASLPGPGLPLGDIRTLSMLTLACVAYGVHRLRRKRIV